jgi:hypothetical protein
VNTTHGMAIPAELVPYIVDLGAEAPAHAEAVILAALNEASVSATIDDGRVVADVADALLMRAQNIVRRMLGLPEIPDLGTCRAVWDCLDQLATSGVRW